MTKRNNGSKSEAVFKKFFEAHKNFVYKFTDTKVARNKVQAVPADFLLVSEEALHLAEVKSVSSGTSFPLSNIGKMQRMVAKLCHMFGHGDRYLFFVHHLATDQWYMFDANMLEREKKKSINFTNMVHHYGLEGFNDE